MQKTITTSIETDVNQRVDIPEKVYEELYSKADILYFSIDSSFSVLSINVTTEEKLGAERYDIAGKNFLNFVVTDQRNNVFDALTECLKKGYLRDREVKLKNSDNKLLVVNINGLASEQKNGDTGIRLYLKDETEKYKLQKQKNLALNLSEYSNNRNINTKAIKEILNDLQQSFLCSGAILLTKKEGSVYQIFDRWDAGLSLSIETDTFRKVSGSELEKFIEIFQTSIICERSEKGSVWTGDITEFLNENKGEIDGRIIEFLKNFKTVSIISVIENSVETSKLILIDSPSESFESEDILFMESVAKVFKNNASHKKFQHSINPIDSNDLLSMFNVPFIGICLVEDGKITRTNKWLASFFDSTEESLIGRELIEFIDTEFHNIVKQLSLSANQSEFISIDDLVVMTDSGDQRKSKVTATQLSSNGSVKELWYFISREDHDRVQRTLLQARKMESLGMLAGGIVHDFNNLLACILGFSSMLSEEISPDNPYYDDIRQITVTAEKATELTSRLMAHTQGSSYIVNNLDVNQLVKEVAGILSRTLEKSISIRAQLEPDLQEIKGDASKIQQAILQVALNARDAMTEGGKIIFKTRNLFLGEDNPWLKYGGKPGKYIQIEITDTGQGMTGDIKERLLKSIESSKKNSEDTGMGVAMVKEILQDHGGFISIFSQQFKGTVVKMHLPAKQQEKSKKSISVENEEPILGKETILLVDDEKIFRETARKMLTRYGYKVISTDSRSEALSIYKKYINRIDLIILDMMMPGMDFSKVINTIKKMNNKVKIITTSEMTKEASVKVRVKDLISGYVQKPFQVRPLLNAVRSVLNA